MGFTSVCSKAKVLLFFDSLVICALIGWARGVVIGPCYAMHFLVIFYFCNHLAKEAIAGCFT